MYELVHLLAKNCVFVRQALGQVFLIDDLLCRLIAVEAEASTGTLHDDGWAEATQNARLVILGRIEAGNHYIVGIDQVRSTGRAEPVGIGRLRKASSVSAINAKDMTESRSA